MDQRYVVGGDLGGTRFRAVLANGRGEVVRRADTLTRAAEGLEAVVNRMATTIESLFSEMGDGLDRARVRAVGLAAPGPLDPWRGIVYSPPNLPGWGDVPLARLMGERLGLPVFLGNDANLAALAEHRFGAGVGADHLVYITVSTGVGGGVIADGKLLLGSGGGAGEIGHMTIERDGPRCGCGNRGCLEALASGTAIARRAVSLLATGAPSRIREVVAGNLSRVTAEVVVQAAAAGDALAGQIIRDAGTALGVGVANVMHLYDPQIIVIGGGVVNAGALLFDPMHAEIERRALAAFRERTRITTPALGDACGVLGAVALALALASGAQ
ncbi:MAG: ROK family protein [Chloroflexi bacterium]|nr:ROK family protein [Chloroflexota bacterium]